MMAVQQQNRDLQVTANARGGTWLDLPALKTPIFEDGGTEQ
jgi:hypothetical protein